MKNQKNTTVYFLFAVCLFITFCLLSCDHKKNDTAQTAIIDSTTIKHKQHYQSVNDAKKLLQDGQLITRSDDDFESLILQNFSRQERAYSHSGILFKEGDEYVVYHCMGGEENPGEAFQRDPFDSFVNPLKKTGFGIFQYQLSKDETGKLHEIMKKNYAMKVPFDASFDLVTNDSLYCSEMIYKALKQATNNRVVLPVSHIDNFKPKIMGYKKNNLFFKRFDFVGIDDLYLNPFCKEITRVKYN